MSFVTPERRDLRGSNGRMLTLGLVYDYNQSGGEEGERPAAIFTMGEDDKEVDGRKLYSLKRIILSCNTEYEVAMKLFGDWEHWLLFKNNNILKEDIAMWLTSIEMRKQALAEQTLISQALNGDVSAAKAILAGKKTKGPVGRPAEKAEKKEQNRKAVVTSILKKMNGPTVQE